MSAQRRFRSACASRLFTGRIWDSQGCKVCCFFFKRTTKTLIRLRGCASWFESSMGHHIKRYIFPRWGPYVIVVCTVAYKQITWSEDKSHWTKLRIDKVIATVQSMESFAYYLMWYWYALRRGNPSKFLLYYYWKRAYHKRKVFAPTGSKFFTFREVLFFGRDIVVLESKQHGQTGSKFLPFGLDHFSEDDCCFGKKTESHKCFLACQKW